MGLSQGAQMCPFAATVMLPFHYSVRPAGSFATACLIWLNEKVLLLQKQDLLLLLLLCYCYCVQ